MVVGVSLKSPLEQRTIKRWADVLPEPVLLAVWIESGSLLIRHAIIGQAVPVGANRVREGSLNGVCNLPCLVSQSIFGVLAKRREKGGG